VYDIIVIGGGPAGASAALFTSKAGKSTLLIDNDKGMTRRAWVRNHYGVEDITGGDLVDIGLKQASHFGTNLVKATVNAVQKQGDRFQVETDDGNRYEGRYIILATGVNVELAEKIGLHTKPGTEPRIKTVVETDSDGRSNIEGIWVAGTAAGVSVHTIITAGDGAKVAINILSEMNGERYVDHDVLSK